MRRERWGMTCNKSPGPDINWGRCDYVVSVLNPKATEMPLGWTKDLSAV